MAAAVQPINVRGPVRAIGMYIGAASGLLLFFFVRDIVQGLRNRRFWFPCSWTTVNAVTLSVIAIATKLPNDISTPMPGGADQLIKLSGTVLTCTFMAFALPSVGNLVEPEEEQNEEGAVTIEELKANLIGLGVVVLTMVVNVCTQLRTGVISTFHAEHIVVLVATLLSFGYMGNVALATLRLDKGSSNSDGGERDRSLVIEYVKKLMRARTGSIQYVVSRSSIGCAAGALTSASLAALMVAMARTKMHNYVIESDYGWTVWPILGVQILAILLGWIVVCIRWWRPVIFGEQQRISLKSSCFDVVEGFWTMKLVQYRPKLPLSMTGFKGKQLMGFLWGLQAHALHILVGWQSASVRMSMVVLACSQWSCYSCVNAKADQKYSINEVEDHVYFLPRENPLGLWDSNFSQLHHKVHKPKRSNISNLTKLLQTAEGNPPAFESITHLKDPFYTSFFYSWSSISVCLVTIMKALEKFYEVEHQEVVEIALDGLAQAIPMIKMIEKTLKLVDEDNVDVLEDSRDFNKLGNCWKPAVEVLGELRTGHFLDLRLDLLHTVNKKRWRNWMLQEVNKLSTEGKTRKMEIEAVVDGRYGTAEGLFGEVKNILERLAVTTRVKGDANDAYIDTWRCLGNVTEYIMKEQPEQFNELERVVRHMLADVVGACLTNLPHAAKYAVWGAESLCTEAIRLRLTWDNLWEQLGWPKFDPYFAKDKNLFMSTWIKGKQSRPWIEDDRGKSTASDEGEEEEEEEAAAAAASEICVDLSTKANDIISHEPATCFLLTPTFSLIKSCFQEISHQSCLINHLEPKAKRLQK